ncbi:MULTISPECIES: hypothetical protein [unclassified Clostridium]|uniref:hypothetical protein n=1 Tax=unclassified Clostridium TaxID=2614128 RepID=UPI0025BF9255|nr:MULTISPECIES: hypothetical protein [unclassified Clostridium]
MENITSFETVYSFFINKIESYDYLNLEKEEIEQDLENKLKVALAKFTTAKDIKAGFDIKMFNRELTYEEIEILSLWMVTEWLKPKVLTEQHLYDTLSSKDYVNHSPANLLDKLILLKKELDSEAYYCTKTYGYKNRRSGKKK